MTINQSTFSVTDTGTASSNGGAIDTTASTGLVTISNDSFSNLTLGDIGSNGGAIQSYGDTAGVMITNDQFSNNSTASDGTAGAGGAIAVYLGSNVSITGSTFNDNAGGNGGAIYATQVSGSNVVLTISGDTFVGNTAVNGGAIYLESPLSSSVSNNIFTANSAVSGGAIYTDNTLSTSLSNNSFSGNTATSFGGAVSLVSGSGSFTSSGDTFTANSTGGDGGAVAILNTSGGTWMFTNDIFGNGTTGSGNTASLYGGAIFYAAYAGTQLLQVTNSSFIGNSADVNRADGYGGNGAAIYVFSSTTNIDIDTTNTFMNNSATGPNGTELNGSSSPVVVYYDPVDQLITSINNGPSITAATLFNDVSAIPGIQTIYVDGADTTNLPIGNPWRNAFTTVQSAITHLNSIRISEPVAAAAMYRILVAGGTYSETTPITIPTEVAIFGGFDSNGDGGRNETSTLAYGANRLSAVTANRDRFHPRWLHHHQR